MIMTELHRFGEIAVPTLLMIGQQMPLAKIFAPSDLRPKLGNYPELGKAAAEAIPNTKLVEFPMLCHAPQMSDPQGFDKALIARASRNPNRLIPANAASHDWPDERVSERARGQISVVRHGAPRAGLEKSTRAVLSLSSRQWIGGDSWLLSALSSRDGNRLIPGGKKSDAAPAKAILRDFLDS